MRARPVRSPVPFTDKQIELVTTFADQAVIAIENVRLFEEVQARTRELTEALEQQTATSEVLQAISRSAFNLRTVLETLTMSAAQLCRADMAVLVQPEGGRSNLPRATTSLRSLLSWSARIATPIDRGTVAGRVLLTGQVVHIEDVANDAEYRFLEGQRTGAYRTTLGVPLLRDAIPVGALVLARSTVQPFDDRQIQLVTTFADQAVIAMENVRLFEEVQARTRELQESLEYQTATSDVLNVISRSTSQIQPVLDTIAETAGRLCESYDTVILLREGEWLKLAAHRGPMPIDYDRWPIGRSWVSGRAVIDLKPVHIPDLAEAAEEFPEGQAMALRMGARTTLAAPLLRENVAIGAILVRRMEVRPFSDKQVEILQTFADQAVIAIENARLFEEVQARTRELAQSVGELQALGEVSQAVNSTLDLQTVLDTIVAKAVQLSGTDAGAIYVFSNLRQKFRLRATYGMSQELIDAIGKQQIDLGETYNRHRAPQQRAAVQVPDLNEEPLTTCAGHHSGSGLSCAPRRSTATGGRIIGALVVRRKAPGEFPGIHDRPPPDLCGAIRARDPERAPVQRDRGEEPCSSRSQASTSRSS